MDGGESAAGGEEQQQQPKPQEEKKEKEVESVVRRVTSRLSAIYENVKPKKKDKTAPIDEEAAKVAFRFISNQILSLFTCIDIVYNNFSGETRKGEGICTGW